MDSIADVFGAGNRSVARSVFWIAMAVWGAVEVRTAILRGGTDTGQDAGSRSRTLGLVFGGLVATLLVDLVLPEVVPSRKHDPFLFVGAVFVAAGLALRIWSIRTLGRFFTYQLMTTADQTVVERGPYRVVRHPSYSGLFLSCLGAGVATANPIALAFAVVLPFLGIARRIAIEETLLERELGHPYRAYSASRRRLIPGVW